MPLKCHINTTTLEHLANSAYFACFVADSVTQLRNLFNSVHSVSCLIGNITLYLHTAVFTCTKIAFT